MCDSDSDGRTGEASAVSADGGASGRGVPAVCILGCGNVLSRLRGVPFRALLACSSSVIENALTGVSLTAGLGPRTTVANMGVAGRMSALSTSVTGVAGDLGNGVANFNDTAACSVSRCMGTTGLLGACSTICRTNGSSNGCAGSS